MPATTPPVRLRSVQPEDIDVFFQHQLDPEANHMAAFTAKDPADRTAFGIRWGRILADDAIIKRTILLPDATVAGHVLKFVMLGKPEVSYWVGKTHWGQGIATAALRLFLAELALRPLYARVAADNHASRRVLEKCGFMVTGQGRGFANARNQETDEIILKLG